MIGTLLRGLAAGLREAATRLRASFPGPGQIADRVTASERVAAVQMRPSRWLSDGSPDPTSYRPIP